MANKYERLAIAMRYVRMNGGYYANSVKMALNDFKPETDEDKVIYADVSEALEETLIDRDGRHLRDTTWNYDVLFQLAEKKALTWTAWELAADWWWRELDCAVKLGRTTYSEAQVSRGYQGVKLQRLRHDLSVVTRYVKSDTIVTLVYSEEDTP